MCGIIGAVARRAAVPVLMEGLRRMEYRGYDSAGMAIIGEGTLRRLRAEGKVAALQDALDETRLSGSTGIAHTRWATHGEPCEHNAHPLVSGEKLALVHNGIIENHSVLRKKLIALGFDFTSDTDSEVIIHLLNHHLTHTHHFLAAVQKTVSELEGAYALGILFADEPHRLIAVRKGSPLVLGLGKDENFFASDYLALLPVTQRFIYLEEGDVADVSQKEVMIYDRDGHEVQREEHSFSAGYDVTERGKYRHYMQKEIFQQPEVLAEIIEGRLGEKEVYASAFGVKAERIFSQVKAVHIVACGTSYHAGCVAKYWLERAGVACRVEVASEYRYGSPVVQPGTLLVTISQSGETADTLAALQQAQNWGYVATLSVCNVPESALPRASDLVLLTRAGPEIGVASTKAFSAQLVGLSMLVAVLGRQYRFDAEQEQSLVNALLRLPNEARTLLTLDETIKQVAPLFADKVHALYLGRGWLYPIAAEGALKLKELSYIHAEAYPAGELKHGPLALVDKDMPVVALVANDPLKEKMISNLHEVVARGGEVLLFAEETCDVGDLKNHCVTLPAMTGPLVPLLYTLPLQLLAYHVALLKGTDVDQPRNLAKSVTVE